MATEEKEKLIGEDIELAEMKTGDDKSDDDEKKDAKKEDGKDDKEGATQDNKKEGDKEEKEKKKKEEIQALIKTILKKEIEVKEIVHEKSEELETALGEGRAETVKKLLEEGAPIDVWDWDENGDIITPLTFAANIDRLDIFCLVLGRALNEGTDDDDLYVKTAMQRACIKNSVLIAKILMKKEVDYEHIYDEYEEKPPEEKQTKHIYRDPEASYLHFCAYFGSREVLKLLLDKQTDIDINMKDGEGNTALHLASRNGYSTCVSYLISKGAKINEINKDKRTALFLAIQNAPEELIYNLIRAGADVNLEDRRGLTAIFTAAVEGRDTLIPILVNNGANVDARNRFYQTPLMIACKSGNAATVRELLLSGASLDAKDKSRGNAFSIARNRKQDEALSVIVRAHQGAENFNNLGWHKVLSKDLYKSILTMLDCLIEPETEKNRVKIDFTVLEIDRKNVTPEDWEYEEAGRRKPYLLQRFASSGNEEIAYHGVTRILVNQKFKRYGNFLLWFKTFIFASFLAAMLYALVQAAQEHRTPQTLYRTTGNTGWDILRYICEIYVVLFWMSNIVTESAEVLQVMFYSRKEIEDKKEEKKSRLQEELERNIRKGVAPHKDKERGKTTREKKETGEDSEVKPKPDDGDDASGKKSDDGSSIHSKKSDKSSTHGDDQLIDIDVPAKTDDKSDSASISGKSDISDKSDKSDSDKSDKSDSVKSDKSDSDKSGKSDASDKSASEASGKKAKSSPDGSDDDSLGLGSDSDSDSSDSDDSDDDDDWGDFYFDDYSDDDDYFDSDDDGDGDDDEYVNYLKEQKKKREEEKQKKEDREAEEPTEREKKETRVEKMKDYLQGNLIIRVFLDYFQDWYNWVDISGLLLLLIVIIYRVIIIFNPNVPYVEFQWVFATFAFAVNAFRLTKLLSVFKLFGTYMRIIILILLKDVPKFLLLLFLTFLFFSTTLYLSYRVPLIQGVRNDSNGTIDYYITLFDLPSISDEGLDLYYYNLLYPLRVLLEGNAFEFNYLFNSFNIVAAIVYVIFLFLIIVVYLNVFIAQLSDTYAEVKANAKKTVAKFRLEFIIQLQTTSMLALFFDFRKHFYDEHYIMEDEEWLEYFNAGISRLDDDDFTTQEPSESLHVVINKLQQQQKVNSRTQEILQTSIEKRVKMQQSDIDEIKTTLTGIGEVKNLKGKLEALETQNKEILEKLSEIAQRV